jgi:hypothetical protein
VPTILFVRLTLDPVLKDYQLMSIHLSFLDVSNSYCSVSKYCLIHSLDNIQGNLWRLRKSGSVESVALFVDVVVFFIFCTQWLGPSLL